MSDGADLFVDNAKPSEPFIFVRAGPKCCITLPEPANFSIRAPIVEIGFHCFREICGQDVGLGAYFRLGALCVLFHRPEKFVERIREKLYSLICELIGDLLHRDAGLCQVIHGSLGTVRHLRSDFFAACHDRGTRPRWQVESC